MTPSRFSTLPLIGLLALNAAACDDGVSPIDLGSLDPLAVTVALDQLKRPLLASGVPIANLSNAIPGLEAAGIAFDRPAATGLTAAFRAVSMAPPAPALAVVIGPELMGATFVYNTATAAWAEDESLQGAPEDGVRVIWYTVDGTGEVVRPLEERGYIDLRPGQNTPADPTMVAIVATEGSPLTLMDYGQWHDTTVVGTGRTEEFGAAGFFADTSNTVLFTLDSRESADSDAGDQSYDLVATLENPETAYTLDVSGTLDGATEDYEDSVMATAVIGSMTTVMELVFQGTGAVQDHASGTISHEGTVVADIIIRNDAFEFAKPGGGELPAGQASELNMLFRALTLTGFDLVYRIPLFFLLQ